MRVSDTGKRLKYLMEERGLKQVDILTLTAPYCEKYGVRMNRSDLSQYVSGKVEPSQEKLTVLSQALNVSEPWLMGYDMSDAPLPHSDLLPVERRRIPLLGDIAAGEPVIAEEQHDTYVEVDADTHCHYALRVVSDSMEPTIRVGDLVFLRQQDDVDDGQIAAVLLDETATLKHVYHQKNGLLLTSDNAKYPPRLVTFEEYDTIRILGRAVAFKRKL